VIDFRLEKKKKKKRSTMD